MTEDDVATGVKHEALGGRRRVGQASRTVTGFDELPVGVGALGESGSSAQASGASSYDEDVNGGGVGGGGHYWCACFEVLACFAGK